jgi:transcription-repair coupling factor (superfamily II helicase)
MTDHPNLSTLDNWVRTGHTPIRVIGLTGSARSYFLSRFLSGLRRPCLIILPDQKEKEKLFKELTFFLQDQTPNVDEEETRLFQFSPYDLTPLTGLSPHRDVVIHRLRALYALLSDEAPIVVTSLDAVAFKIMPKSAFVQSLEYLESGEEVEREGLIRRLENTGYLRVSLVEEKGEYSIRGGVIDIFPPLYDMPVRLEFWGDRVESIRQFDPLSQRSHGHLQEAVIIPANEIIMDPPNTERARSMGRLPLPTEGMAGFPGQEAWLKHFYPHLDTLFHYLAPEGLVVVFDIHRAEAICGKIGEQFGRDLERLRDEAAQQGKPFPDVDGVYLPFSDLRRLWEDRQRVELMAVELGLETARPQRSLHFTGLYQVEDDLEVRLKGRGRVSLAPLAQKITAWLQSHSRVVLVCRTQQQADRLKEILENYEVLVDQVVDSWSKRPQSPGLTICLGRLARGFTWPELGLYVVSEDEVFGPKKARPVTKRKSRDRALTWSSFSQLKAGDLVVHEEHGIGQYQGLSKMEIERKINDFVLIQYAQNDRLYIPADRVSILQKYVGVDGVTPKLDQLGGRSWNLAKQKAKKSVKTIAKQLIQLYALRKYRKGYAFSLPDHQYREFEATFEHEETPDQIKVIEEVLEEMSSDIAMDRLVCGDVGFGKTEVAIRAAFKAVSDGKQVALLVPTTVLAEQHYETFKKRMDPFSIRVGNLSRFKSQKEQSRILAQLRSGKIHILVGTHRILQKDVTFVDLGLLIIDEEQRFGVKQKEALKKYRALVDVLALTATPIPRTLQMSMMGVRDLSVIETPPEDRLSVQSYLSPFDEALLVRAIEFELERGGQVFFVHNRVQTIDHVADRLKQLVPRARIAVAHGQMKERDLERTMMDFVGNVIDVLVCTTIIESGLDIPSANTIIINEVDRLGLAQIYQLRGRVGRAKEKAYAYLLLSDGATLTRDAEKRLKALMEYSHLGAGLHLAMHDLKIRGGGNILGFSQSGQISAVGYELYLKLIERAIAELKGEAWHEDVNPEINMDISAFLPEEYVIDTDVRLNLYRRFSGLREPSDLEAITEEIQDRFGPPPPEVSNFLGLMSLRLLLKRHGLTRLDVGPNSFALTISKESSVDPGKLVTRVSSKPERFRFLSQSKLEVTTGPLSYPMDLYKIEQAIRDLIH